MSAAGASFDADWLALREPFDAAARGATQHLVDRLRAMRAEPGPWRVMDLGCGTGANLRWLAPRLGGAQQWLVLDHDAALLSAWERHPGFRPRGRQGHLRWSGPGFQVDVQRQRADLAHGLAALPWHAAQLLTASAWLDLVGREWLVQLVSLAAAARVPVLFALSVDGVNPWSPADADDAAVDRLFAAHQQRDKGMGPALGAQAVPWLAQHLRGHGYRVETARSDWLVAPGAASGDADRLLRALVDGTARAAIEQAPSEKAMVQAWHRRRSASLRDSTLRVGHLDLLAWPAR